MSDISPQDTPVKSCPFSACSFNFCFVAKALVAIPALTIAALWASSFFENPFLNFLAMTITVFALVFAAIKIDKMPALSGMIVKRKCGK